MSEAKWYVVHTYSGYENKVKANIDKTVENRQLEDQILEVRVPMEEVVELKNGVQKVKYTYNALSELTRVDSAWENKSITYTYDAGMNMTSRKEYSYKFRGL